MSLRAIAPSSGNTVITGGSIDNTPIGATTPSTGAFTTLTDTGLTSGRVTYAGTGGLLKDSANLTFNGTTLTNTGNAIISDNSANAALRVTQVGAGNALLVEDSANPDASPFVIDASGNVGIGTATPYVQLEAWSSISSPTLGEATGIGSVRITNGATALSSTGGLEFKIAGDASGFGSKIQALNSTGVQLVFANRNFSATWSEYMRIGSAGVITLGGTVGSQSFQVTPVASAVNYVSVFGAATGVAPSMSAVGSDTNVDLQLLCQGTGNIRFGTYTAGVVAQAGYITIKDAGGTSRRLLVG